MPIRKSTICSGNLKGAQILGKQQANKIISNKNLIVSLFKLIIGTRKHCFVQGCSMLPTLGDGDLLIYKPFIYEEDFLQEGIIVVIKHPFEQGQLIVKSIEKYIAKREITVLG